MGKIEEAREFLQEVGMPRAQQADICCYVILAMAGIKPDMSWSEATNEWIRIHDIIQFSNTYYGSTYAENSRETFRKQALHRFRTAAIVEDNGKATNSPNYRYRLTDEILQIIKMIQTLTFQQESIMNSKRQLLRNLLPDLHQIQNVFMLGIRLKRIW